MRIRIGKSPNCEQHEDRKMLIIESELIKEDFIVEKWHEQIIEHLQKLNIIEEKGK